MCCVTPLAVRLSHSSASSDQREKDRKREGEREREREKKREGEKESLDNKGWDVCNKDADKLIVYICNLNIKPLMFFAFCFTSRPRRCHLHVRCHLINSLTVTFFECFRERCKLRDRKMLQMN